ncbi:MAG: glycosyltransferase family 2 protein [Solirubrobacterales bacterium]|nr:glycosyltransferase family 2 protein [Solirubrobacterales bacterium]
MASTGGSLRSEGGVGLTVDVVITNHNYGRFLEEALESACGQTYPGVNVIVVDDGSTDDSAEILARFSDRVDVLFKDRGGQASALNAGFERCAGDVLLLLDADDRLHPRAAELIAAAFAADRDLAKVQFKMDVVDAVGRATGETRPSYSFEPPTGDLRRAELAFPFDLPWLPGGGTGFRRQLLSGILPIPEQEFPRWGADWYLVHLSALVGPAAALDESLADYRVHGANGYELTRPELDLDRIRDSIRYARSTTRALESLADDLGIPRPDRLLSTADLANRMISLKLQPRSHPVADDRRGRVLLDAARALRRRFDVHWPTKALLAAWFLAEAAAPKPLARPLATLFLFPERRVSLDPLLRRLRKQHVSANLAKLR